MRVEESEVVQLDVETMAMEGYLIRFPFRLYYVRGHATLGENNYDITSFKYKGDAINARYLFFMEFRDCRNNVGALGLTSACGFMINEEYSFDKLFLHFIDWDTWNTEIVKAYRVQS
ncbi:MAG: hypothetical protein LR001_09470 [Clostridiales bacterium]|nr:hypothetical protein [Clostridiales bacterium]